MPLYDFKCSNPDCKHEFEEQIELGEGNKTVCPECFCIADKQITNPGHCRHISWSNWRI